MRFNCPNCKTNLVGIAKKGTTIELAMKSDIEVAQINKLSNGYYNIVLENNNGTSKFCTTVVLSKQQLAKIKESINNYKLEEKDV